MTLSGSSSQALPQYFNLDKLRGRNRQSFSLTIAVDIESAIRVYIASIISFMAWGELNRWRELTEKILLFLSIPRQQLSGLTFKVISFHFI